MQQKSNYLSILPFLPYAKLLGSLLSWKYGEKKEILLLVLQSICWRNFIDSVGWTTSSWNCTVDYNDEEDHVLFDLSGRECNLKFRTFETFHSDVTADRNQFQIRPEIKLLNDWTHISGSFVIMSTLWRRTLQKQRWNSKNQRAKDYLHRGSATAQHQDFSYEIVSSSADWLTLKESLSNTLSDF